MSSRIWYSFYDRNGYNGDEPYFFEPKSFEWTKIIEDNWFKIREELDAFLQQNVEMMPYFDQQMVTRAASWKTIPFAAWGVWFEKNCKKAPTTKTLLQSIPGCVSASFNLLEAGATIKPHYGDTNAIVRCHLGLYIPAPLPETGFRVGTAEQSWHNGKLLIFCDAHYHTAWNNSNENRYILLFDVIRPEYMCQKNSVCSSVLASLFLQSMLSRLPAVVAGIFIKTPLFFQFIVFRVAKVAARCSMPLYNAWQRWRYRF